ncbi:MAG: type II toxin-antitoxin system RelE/ParE family toxin [Desulfocapsaceae bacterium]|jgi:plasmid stabilization system protein ParE|nr:type II toxin-antitoxin system RelE/ParE family toxin [Desulfocapsaceae bacterium]
MNIIILAHAEQEFIEAVDYYNVQCPGLGYEFATEITTTLNRISSFPEAWPRISPRTRRCITNKFPYGVIYQIQNNNILVVAIMHMKRNPIGWQNR